MVCVTSKQSCIQNLVLELLFIRTKESFSCACTSFINASSHVSISVGTGLDDIDLTGNADGTARHDKNNSQGGGYGSE